VRVTTTQSPSWVAWSEIEVLDANGTNVALNKSVNASSTYGDSDTAFAVDGNTSTSGGSGDFPPATITVDLGQAIAVHKVRLRVAQMPAGATTHTLYFGDTNEQFSEVHTFTGTTSNGDLLVYSAAGIGGNTPFNLDEVVWLHTNVTDWPVTTNLSVNLQGGTICFNYDKQNSWPGVPIEHNSGNYMIDVVANPWVFVQHEGQWYGGTWEWFVAGSACKNKTSVAADHIKQPPLSTINWTPTSGETLYFMVSGLARFSNIKNVSERSNIVEIIWP